MIPSSVDSLAKNSNAASPSAQHNHDHEPCIITNNHPFKDLDNLMASFFDKRPYSAKVIRADPKMVVAAVLPLACLPTCSASPNPIHDWSLAVAHWQ